MERQEIYCELGSLFTSHLRERWTLRRIGPMLMVRHDIDVSLLIDRFGRVLLMDVGVVSRRCGEVG